MVPCYQQREPASNSALIPLDIDGVLFPRARFPSGVACYNSSKDGHVTKKDKIVMKCQLSVYLLRTLFECSGSIQNDIFEDILSNTDKIFLSFFMRIVKSILHILLAYFTYFVLMPKLKNKC